MPKAEAIHAAATAAATDCTRRIWLLLPRRRKQLPPLPLVASTAQAFTAAAASAGFKRQMLSLPLLAFKPDAFTAIEAGFPPQRQRLSLLTLLLHNCCCRCWRQGQTVSLLLLVLLLAPGDSTLRKGDDTCLRILSHAHCPPFMHATGAYQTHCTYLDSFIVSLAGCHCC